MKIDNNLLIIMEANIEQQYIDLERHIKSNTNHKLVLKNNFDQQVLNDIKFFLKFESTYPHAILFASESLQKLVPFATGFLRNRPDLIIFLPQELRDNIHIAKTVLSKDGHLYNIFSLKVRKDPNIINIALNTNYTNLEFVPKAATLKISWDFYKNIFFQFPDLFTVLNSKLTQDPVFIEEIIEKSGSVMKYVDKKFWNDDLLITAINNDYSILEILDSKHFDTKKVLESVQHIFQKYKSDSFLHEYASLLEKLKREEDLTNNLPEKTKNANKKAKL